MRRNRMKVSNGGGARNGRYSRNGRNGTNGTKGRKGTTRTNLKGCISVIVLCMLFSSLFAAPVHAAECENALVRCLNDPYWHMTLAGPVYCATGYLFCKKYVEG